MRKSDWLEILIIYKEAIKENIESDQKHKTRT